MGKSEDHKIVSKIACSNRLSFNHERVSEMLKYITEMPPEGSSHDRGHKHPFTVSEVFSYEVSQINDLFFTAPPSPSPFKPNQPQKVDQNNEDEKLPENQRVEDEEESKLDDIKKESSSSEEEDDDEVEHKDSSSSSSSEDEDKVAGVVEAATGGDNCLKELPKESKSL